MAALYALVLQAVLGGMAVTAALDPAHALCLVEAGAGEGPAEPHAAHGHPPCCTAAHAPEAASPPIPAMIAVIWPERRSLAVIRPSKGVAAARAPPGVNAGARAPPVV